MGSNMSHIGHIFGASSEESPRGISNLSFWFNGRINVPYQPCKERGSGLGGIDVGGSLGTWVFVLGCNLVLVPGITGRRLYLTFL